MSEHDDILPKPDEEPDGSTYSELLGLPSPSELAIDLRDWQPRVHLPSSTTTVDLEGDRNSSDFDFSLSSSASAAGLHEEVAHQYPASLPGQPYPIDSERDYSSVRASLEESSVSDPSTHHPQPSSRHIPRSVLLPVYELEARRLATFGNWPVSAPIGKEELARAGFVHNPMFWPTRCMDRVQCAFCRGILYNWQPNQRAFHKHQKYWPGCPFVLNPTAPQNVQECKLQINTPRLD